MAALKRLPVELLHEIFLYDYAACYAYADSFEHTRTLRIMFPEVIHTPLFMKEYRDIQNIFRLLIDRAYKGLVNKLHK